MGGRALCSRWLLLLGDGGVGGVAGRVPKGVGVRLGARNSGGEN